MNGGDNSERGDRVISPGVGRKPYGSGGGTRTDYVRDYRVPLGNATGW